MIGIYEIFNKVTSKRYIGKSETNIEERWKSHRSLLNNNKHYNLYLQRAFNKNPDSFEFNVIELCNIKDIDEREIYWIQKHKSYSRQNGYNLTYGGEGGRPTEETLEKIRKTSTGRMHSKETKDFISKLNTGRKRTKEEREKISLSKLGKPSWNKGKTGIYSDETRLRMSISSKIRNEKNPPIGDKNGMFGKTHSKETKMKMSEMRRGENNARYIKFTNDQLMEIIELRLNGHSINKIAIRFGVCESTIEKRLKGVKKGDKMNLSGYLAMRIELGKLDYTAVVTKYPQFKSDIDEILINDGYHEMIVEQA
ncbi:NUMOD3 domain-containing DNA-binding protein [Gottfriedia sp. S16(2024)]|uniref:NUMOD3 domain-containing DNA-binding protein n=1 Tax=Gottfriedia sp. S16(2024) TaxID=3162883 RepID=UPI003D1AD26F